MKDKDNKYHLRLQKDLCGKLEEILFQEVLWFQKSWCKWLKFGDKNSHYFHCTTLLRKQCNLYARLLNEKGYWVPNPIDLEEMVTSFYRNLFTEVADY